MASWELAVAREGSRKEKAHGSCPRDIHNVIGQKSVCSYNVKNYKARPSGRSVKRVGRSKKTVCLLPASHPFLKRIESSTLTVITAPDPPACLPLQAALQHPSPPYHSHSDPLCLMVPPLTSRTWHRPVPAWNTLCLTTTRPQVLA